VLAPGRKAVEFVYYMTAIVTLAEEALLGIAIFSLLSLRCADALVALILKPPSNYLMMQSGI
jgi:hypothetical protein